VIRQVRPESDAGFVRVDERLAPLVECAGVGRGLFLSWYAGGSRADIVELRRRQEGRALTADMLR
jgi:hypothetical protein